MSSIGYGVPAPLIPGDENMTDGIFDGDVKVTGMVMASIDKVNVPVKVASVVTTPMSGVLTTAQLLNGICVTSGAFQLPSATTFISDLKASTAYRAVGLSPTVGDVFSVDILPAIDSTISVTSMTVFPNAPFDTSFTTAGSGSTLKLVVQNVTTPSVYVYRIN